MNFLFDLMELYQLRNGNKDVFLPIHVNFYDFFFCLFLFINDLTNNNNSSWQVS